MFLININENILNYLNLKKTYHVRNDNLLGPKKEIDGLSAWTFKWVPMGFFIWNFQNFPSFYVSSYGEIIKNSEGGVLGSDWNGVEYPGV